MPHLNLQSHAPTQSFPITQSFPEPSGSVQTLAPVQTPRQASFRKTFFQTLFRRQQPAGVVGGTLGLGAGAGIVGGTIKGISRFFQILRGGGTFKQKLIEGIGIGGGAALVAESVSSTIAGRPFDVTAVANPAAIASGVGFRFGGLPGGLVGAAIGLGAGGASRIKQVGGDTIDAVKGTFPDQSSVSPFSFFGIPDPLGSGPEEPSIPFAGAPPIETTINLSTPPAPSFSTVGPSISGPNIQVGGGGGLPLGLLALLLGGAGIAGFAAGKKRKKKKVKKHKHRAKKAKKKHKVLIRRGTHP